MEISRLIRKSYHVTKYLVLYVTRCHLIWRKILEGK